MTLRRNISSALGALDRLAGAEREFLAGKFVAGVSRGNGVRVRVGGVLCTMRVTPAGFEGLGLFEPRSHALARLVRPATEGERRAYLDLFPAVNLVLCRADGRGDGRRWVALPAHQGDGRVPADGLVPLRLTGGAGHAGELELFDTAVARFDGSQFWYDSVSPTADPGAADYLRRALAHLIDPHALDRAGLTGEQRSAYAAAYLPELERLLAGRQEDEHRAAELRAAEQRVRDVLAGEGAADAGPDR